MSSVLNALARSASKRRAILGLAVAGALTGALLAVQLGVTGAQDDPESLVGVGGCQGSSASFVGATSLGDLLGRADLVLRGRVIDRVVNSDRYELDAAELGGLNLGDRWVVHDVQVLEVLYGTEPASTVSVGDPFGYCMNTGEEYYMFLGRERSASEEYLDDSARYQNPATYGFRSFGPANVFGIMPDGSVWAESRFTGDNGSRYEGVSDSVFRADLAQAVAGMR